MDDTAQIELPALFQPHPHLSDEINANLVRSEVEGVIHLRDLAPGAVLEVQTCQRRYAIVNQGDGAVLIYGHPEYCPTPVLVKIHGSTWGGSLLKEQFIGRGMHLEFRHPNYLPITTSRIIEVRERPSAPAYS